MLMLQLAWRNIWRQPRRTQLTLAAMVFANILLVFMISMQAGMYSMMIDNTLRLNSGHYQIQAEGYLEHPAMHKTLANGEQLAQDLRQKLGNIVSTRAQGFALFSSEQRSYGAQLTGIDTLHETQISSLPGLIKQWRYLIDNNAREVVLGKILARNLKVNIGDEVTLLGSGKDGSIAADIVTVVGLFDTGNKQIDRMLAQMPINTFQTLFSMQEDVHAIVITSESLESSKKLVNLIQAPEKSRLLNWVELEPGLMQAIKADIGSALFIYIVLVMLSGFSVLNTVLMTVLERTREFGLFMALGLRPGQISRLIILESVFLSFLGLIIGMLLGGLLTYYFEVNGMIFPGYEEAAARFNLPNRVYPSVEAISLLLGPGFVFLAAMLASIYPALKILRLHPLHAMRSE